MENKKIIAWFSCGVTSAIACKLAIQEYGVDNVELYYMHIASAHPDNERFIRDCEKWYGKKIKQVAGKYLDQFDVIEQTKYVNGAAGARCTLELKKNIRKKIERDTNWTNQIFGFEFSKKEINRAIRFSQQHNYTNALYPLIDAKITKEECAELLLKNGIKLPTMYELGFHNNNCIMCVKGGKGYANHVRKHFPSYFERMAKLEREVGRSCIKGTFLDELDLNDGKHDPPIIPDCGTFCEVKHADILDKRTEPVLSGLTTMKQLNLFK